MIEIIAFIDSAYHVCHCAVNRQPSRRVSRDEEPLAIGDYIIIGPGLLRGHTINRVQADVECFMEPDGSGLALQINNDPVLRRPLTPAPTTRVG